MCDHVASCFLACESSYRAPFQGLDCRTELRVERVHLGEDVLSLRLLRLNLLLRRSGERLAD